MDRSLTAKMMAVGTITGLLLTLFSAEINAQAPAVDDSQNPVDCRFVPTLTDDGDDTDFDHLGFPRDDIFRPLLAASLEPRFYGDFGWSRFSPELSDGDIFDSFIYSLVGLGGSAGIWSWRNKRTCEGLQLNLFGSVNSLFAFNPLFLINVDYQGGVSATAKRGAFSGRLRIYHQSSHLGDDFLLEHPDFPAHDLSFETADAVASFHGDWGRLYLGGGYMLRVEPADLGRATLQAGAEFYPHNWQQAGPIPTMAWTPMAATDVLSHQARDWAVTSTTKLGVELVGRQQRRARVLVTARHGYAPFGIFFDDHQVTSAGLEAQFIY